jgi:hypothetical protein
VVTGDHRHGVRRRSGSNAYDADADVYSDGDKNCCSTRGHAGLSIGEAELFDCTTDADPTRTDDRPVKIGTAIAGLGLAKV